MTKRHPLHKAIHQYHKKSVKRLVKKHKKVLDSLKKGSVTLIGTAVIAGGLHNVDAPKKSSTIKVKTVKKKKKDTFQFKNKPNATFLSINPTSESVLPSQDKTYLSPQEEEQIKDFLSFYFGIPLAVELEGNRLPNVSGSSIWGYFGQEQHLYRWPGDTLSKHSSYLKHGIAPKYGAFGYFDNAEQEKYYIAVPIHLLPNWNTHWSTLKPWYRYRKVLVFNPKNKRAVVAVIGDAGPAKWTGKHFGGSPEVMHYLQMVDGRNKSKAIVLFIDDKDDKIKLGPIKHFDLSKNSFVKKL